MFKELVIWSILFAQYFGRFITGTSTVLIDKQFPRKAYRLTEAFFFNIGFNPIHFTNCSIVVANKKTALGIIIKESIEFSPMVAVNQTISPAIKLMSDNQAEMLLDYRMDESGDYTEFEIALFMNKESLTTRVELNLLPQVMNLTSPRASSMISQKALHTQAGSWPLKIHVSKMIKTVAEIGYEMPLENTYRIYFKLSHFNNSISNSFKKVTIFEFNSQNKSKEEITTLLTSATLLPFPRISEVDRQYLVYMKNNNTIYLITSLGQIGYDNKITIQKKELNFSINKMMYSKGEILFIEKHEQFRRIDGSMANNYLNYYVRHRLGDRFKLENLNKLKEMYRGVILDSYYTIDKNHLLFDLLCPDLESGEEATLITTLFFNPGSYNFEIFTENIRIMDSKLAHVFKSYHRVSSTTYTVEIFLLKTDLEKGLNSSTLKVTNRITGESLGSMKLNAASRVEKMLYNQVSSSILLKTSNETILLKISEAEFLIKLNITKTVKYSEDAFLINNYFFKFVTLLKCFDTQLQAWNTTYEVEFKGIDLAWSQTYDYRGQKQGANFSLARGQTLELHKTYFCMESFSQIKIVGNQSLFSHENLFMDPTKLTIKLPTENLAQLVYFHFRGGKKNIGTLILDHDELTAYYQLKGSRFEWKANGFDSRHISDIWPMTPNDIFVNISKNLYSLSMSSLNERPITTLGSYCLVAKRFSLTNLPYLMACFTEDNLIVTYITDRFSSTPAQLGIQQTTLQSLLKHAKILKVLYSSFTPNMLVLLVQGKENKFLFSFFLLDFQTKNSITVNIRTRKHIHEFDLKKDSIMDCHLVETYLLLITNSSTIYQYVIRDKPNTSQKSIDYLRKYSVPEFFKENIEGKITASYAVTLREVGSNTFKKETRIVERLVIKVMVTESKENGDLETHENAAILNTNLHSTSGFNWLFNPYQCKRLPSGPAFLYLDRQYTESVVFACCKSSGKSIDKNADIFVLKQYIPKFWIAEGNNLEDVLMGRVHSRARANSAQFNVTCEKQLIVDKFAKLHPNPATVKPVLPYTINIHYINPYQALEAKLVSQDIKMERNSSESFLGLLLYSQKTTKVSSTASLFSGHVFNTWIVCDSQPECLNNVIELFDTPKMTEIAVFNMKKQDTNIHFTAIEIPGFRFVGIIGSEIKYSKVDVSNNSVVNNTVVPLGHLQDSCSEAESYSHYILSVCINSDQSYVIRVFDILKNLSWYEIKLDMLVTKAINVAYANIEIHRNYLAILTYNPKFEIYLSGYLFKMMTGTDQLLRLVYLGETSMNDEVVHFRVFTSQKAKGNSTDKIYFWSTTRANSSHYLIRVNGYAVVDKDGRFSLEHVCRYRMLPVGFNFTGDLQNDYLLNSGKILILSKSEGNSPYFDIILNLPFADDFLMRFPQSSLENPNKSDIDILKEMKVLRISNPFFGIKTDDPLEPIFVDDNYFVAINDFSRRSVFLCYLINNEARSKAVAIEGRYIGLAPNDLPGASKIEIIFTYSVLNFSQTISGIHKTVYLRTASFVQEDDENESALVHMFFSDGSVKSLETSHNIKLRINSNFAASDKVVLYARGPSRVQSIDVLLLDENDRTSLQVGFTHLIVITTLSWLIICLTRSYLRHQWKNEQQRQADALIPDDGENSSEVEAAAKTTADDKSPD